MNDTLGRDITFYLSKERGADPVPLVLYIQGSGCQSAFVKRGHSVTGGYQNVLLGLVGKRARVMVVEKPGVTYLARSSKPGTAEKASREFLEEHTLPRWAEANCAALRAGRSLTGSNSSKVLVIGHSEGGLVAARVAADEQIVTHVASLAGGGPTQLFSLMELARAGKGITDRSGEEGVQEVIEAWKEIQADPDSVARFWLGHPYRRWSSFLSVSVTEELLRTNARIYLAQGSNDDKSPAIAFDVLYAELLAKGKDVIAERVPDSEHGFRTSDLKEPAGMHAVMARVVEWLWEP